MLHLGLLLQLDQSWTPLWPAFSSRVSRWTAFILIAPDKCFPWHTISPPPPSLVVLFHMPKHFNDIGFQAFSSLAELMEQGSYRAEQSADLFFLEGKTRRKGREKKQRGKDLEESDKGHVLGLLGDSLIILHFEQKQWWERNIYYLSKWQFAHLMPVLCRPDILSSTDFALI